MNSKKIDKIATIFFYVISSLLVVFLGLFIFLILKDGLFLLDLDFLISSPKMMSSGGGIGPQLFNSLYILVISLIITVPIGVLAAIYLAEYAKEGPFLRFIRLALDTMSSLPSIVIGMFGLLVFVNMAGFGYSVIAGALSVSILNIPSMTRIAERAIKISGKRVKEASIGLGATRWQTTIKVVLPSAIKEIITGVILSAGRIFGEAAAFLYTAGLVSNKLDFSNINILGDTSAFSLFRPAETLAVHIWKLNSEGIVPDATIIANKTAAVLIMVVLIFNIIAKIIGKRMEKKYGGE